MFLTGIAMGIKLIFRSQPFLHIRSNWLIPLIRWGPVFDQYHLEVRAKYILQLI